MRPTLSVHALPENVELEELAGATVAVIDVLRAATTIVHALHSGAKRIIPCLEVSDALAQAKRFPADQIVLGGERHGTPIDGFQLGNSPEEYSSDRVHGKTVLFTTTNGTRALLRAQRADEVFVAAFVNSAAVVKRLLDREKVCILCSGSDGRASEDDLLLAGLLVDRLQHSGGIFHKQNSQAVNARVFWLNSLGLPQAIGSEPLGPDRLTSVLRKTVGARRLIALGLDDDIRAAAQIDRFDLTPRLDRETFFISSPEA